MNFQDFSEVSILNKSMQLDFSSDDEDVDHFVWKIENDNLKCIYAQSISSGIFKFSGENSWKFVKMKPDYNFYRIQNIFASFLVLPTTYEIQFTNCVEKIYSNQYCEISKELIEKITVADSKNDKELCAILRNAIKTYRATSTVFDICDLLNNIIVNLDLKALGNASAVSKNWSEISIQIIKNLNIGLFEAADKFMTTFGIKFRRSALTINLIKDLKLIGHIFSSQCADLSQRSRIKYKNDLIRQQINEFRNATVSQAAEKYIEALEMTWTFSWEGDESIRCLNPLELYLHFRKAERYLLKGNNDLAISTALSAQGFCIESNPIIGKFTEQLSSRVTVDQSLDFCIKIHMNQISTYGTFSLKKLYQIAFQNSMKEGLTDEQIELLTKFYESKKEYYGAMVFAEIKEILLQTLTGSDYQKANELLPF